MFDLTNYSVEVQVQVIQSVVLIVTIIVTIWSTKKMNRATLNSTKEMIKDNLLRAFREQLDSILKISIEYPFLERDEFVKGWKDSYKSTKDEHVRYDLYCTLVFNLGERVSEFFKFDDKKINTFINFRDWIRFHKNYWSYSISPEEDKKSYKKPYRDLIKKWLNE
jgi:hypothetical protein